VGEPDLKSVFREALAGLGGPGNDLGPMHDALPPLTEFLSAFASPDFVCVMAGLPPTPPTVYPGVEFHLDRESALKVAGLRPGAARG
jgi:hypothetical protein